MPSSPTPTRDPEDEAARVLDLTLKAEALLAEGDAQAASNLAGRAATMKAATDRTWLIVAHSAEALREWPEAFGAYGQALERTDRPGDIAGPMAQMALRLGYFSRAVSLFETQLEHAPPTPETIAGLAWALAKTQAHDDAQTRLQEALQADPSPAILWLTLGRILSLRGRHQQAPVFLQEALRLDPASAEARDALADALLFGGGDPEDALAWGREAVASADGSTAPAVVANQAHRLLATGCLHEGWTALARGFDPEDPAATCHPRAAARRWREGMPLDGRLLLIAEDSLVSQILFAHMIPDLVAEGLPVTLAIHPSWAALARRSFPGVKVVARASRIYRGDIQAAAELESPHVHEGEVVAAWAPLSALMPSRRSRPEQFAWTGPYIRPNPERVAYWRERLNPEVGARKVGVAWRGLAADGAQGWEAPPTVELAVALSLPGVTLVALQQQPAFGETQWFRDVINLDLHDLPEDFRSDDLEDFAAVIAALDVVVGPPSLATILAAAMGAPTIILSTPWHWPRLGTDHYPWFPHARVIVADAPGAWEGALEALREALADLAAR